MTGQSALPSPDNCATGRDRLTEAGWYQGRVVELGPALAALAEAGHVPDDTFLCFAAQYEGLVVRYTCDDGFQDEIHFNIREGCANATPGWARRYSQRCGEVLIPFGTANTEHTQLLRSPAGNFYGGFDDEFWMLGRCVEELVENIVATRTLPSTDNFGSSCSG
jgi:hypothetical protein